LFAVEAPDDAHAGEGFGGLAVDALACFSDVAVHRSDAGDPGSVAEPDEGDERDGADEHAPVDEGEDDEGADELSDGAPGVVDEAEDEVSDASGVFAEHGGDAAGLHVLDAVEGESCGVFEGASSESDLDAFDEAGALPSSPGADDGGDDGGGEDDGADDAEERHGVLGEWLEERASLGRVGDEDVVEDDFGGVGGEEVECGGDGEREEGEGEGVAMASEDAEEGFGEIDEAADVGVGVVGGFFACDGRRFGGPPGLESLSAGRARGTAGRLGRHRWMVGRGAGGLVGARLGHDVRR